MKEGYPPEVEERLRADSREIVARYPVARSALMPMLHLVQSVDGFVSPRGIALCADVLGLTRAEVSAVATFYSQYRRHPNGEYNVGVCTNALCAVMGGDEIWEALTSALGVGSDETTPDGKITLEALNATRGCDYAPVVMVNWGVLRQTTTPTSALQIVEDIRAAGTSIRLGAPTRCTPSRRRRGSSPDSRTGTQTKARVQAAPRSEAWRSRANAAGARRRRSPSE